MVKFLKPGKVVVLLNGRFAGRKAVIVKNFDDGTSQRPYGHALVTGIASYPRKVSKKLPAKKLAKRCRLKTFVKTVNYTHVMPTRYTLDVELKNIVTPESVDTATKKKEANKQTKALFEEKFKTGKNRWFFSKLRF
eukprot:jgi/Mesvir1/3780/Mv08187-RA.1